MNEESEGRDKHDNREGAVFMTQRRQASRHRASDSSQQGRILVRCQDGGDGEEHAWHNLRCELGIDVSPTASLRNLILQSCNSILTPLRPPTFSVVYHAHEHHSIMERRRHTSDKF